MSKRWKAVELEVARLFGGRRAGAVGRHGTDVLDCEPFAVQVKHGRTAPIPQWLEAAMEQAERDATDGQLPVVVLHAKGHRVLDSLVVIRLRDFRDWFLPPHEPA